MTYAAHGDDAERVKSASDIVDVVGEHISLRPRGREFLGLCPFHDDHKPSMAVIPHKQIFYCHACGTGGDVFSFIQKYHRMDFRASLEFLAQRAGIELQPRQAPSPAQAAAKASSEQIEEANRFAQRYFRSILAHPEHGREARVILERRGISQEMVESFQLGASADRFDGLILKAQSSGFDFGTLAQAGLIKDRDGRRYDAFRNRIMFPIHDQVGRVIAFGGRRIDDAVEPKYLNSPETPLFHKSDALYGLYQASRSIQRQRVAVVVEGYTDVIACHQAGLTNVVGTLGTALTAGHARILRRLCDEVVLLFDGDEAGERAAERAVEVFFDQPIDVKIATLSGNTTAKDPAELLSDASGVETLHGIIDRGVELLEYRFLRIRNAWSKMGPAALNKALTEEVRTLANLGLARLDPVARGLIIRRLHELTGLADDVIAEAVRAASSRARPSQEERSARVSLGRSLSAAEAVIGCLLVEPKLWKAHADELELLPAGTAFADANMQAVAEQVLGLIRSGTDPSLETVLALDHRPAVQAAAIALANATESQTERKESRVTVLLSDCLAQLSADRVRGQAAEDEDVLARLERERAARRKLGTAVRANPWKIDRSR